MKRLFGLVIRVQLPVLLPAVIAVLIAGCGVQDEQASHAAPRRIISLDPAATELVYACGMSAYLVGVDVTSVYPPEVQTVSQLGHTRNLKPEALLALNPDCVFASEGSLPESLHTALKAAGVELVQPPRAYTLQGATDFIRVICNRLGHAAVADSIIQNMEQTCAAIQPFREKPRVLFVYARGGGNLMVAGANTALQGFIALSGAENAVSGFEDFKPLTPEALPAADPDVILMFTSSVEGLERSGGLDAIPGYSALSETKAIYFVSMESRYLSSFGPGLCEGISLFHQQMRNLGFQ